MSTLVQDWPRYVAEIFRVTALGGHIQLTELAFRVEPQNGQLPRDSGLTVVEGALRKHATFKHYNLEVESDLAALVRNAGFHGVEEKVFSVPVGGWNAGSQSYFWHKLTLRSQSCQNWHVDVGTLF